MYVSNYDRPSKVSHYSRPNGSWQTLLVIVVSSPLPIGGSFSGWIEEQMVVV